MENMIERFASAYENYYNLVYRRCLYEFNFNEQTAEDASDEIFIALLKNIHKVDDSKIKAWLHSTTDKKIKEFRRRYKRRCRIDDISKYRNSLRDTSTQSMEELLLIKAVEETDIDLEIINSLRPIEQQLIKYIRDGNMTYAQIGEEMGLTPSEVTMRVYRLRKKVKKLIAERLNKVL